MVNQKKKITHQKILTIPIQTYSPYLYKPVLTYYTCGTQNEA